MDVVVKDCKYRLPCNWCDKYDRECEHVKTELIRQCNIEKPKPKECKHDWQYVKTDCERRLHYYLCPKCGLIDIRRY